MDFYCSLTYVDKQTIITIHSRSRPFFNQPTLCIL